MRIDVISVIPMFFQSFLQYGLIKIALQKELIRIEVHDLHEYGVGAYRKVDDTPYGGGAGMILKPEPIFECIENLKNEREYDEVIFLSPDGKMFEQGVANELSLKKNIIILCGHYKGVDERVRERLITREISIGDYVLSGGEIPAMCMIDAVARLIPGVLHDGQSALTDSFQNGLLDSAYYTKPAMYRDMAVPKELLSGNHKEIERWREENAVRKTTSRRPDMNE